jgi:hypothetical protein
MALEQDRVEVQGALPSEAPLPHRWYHKAAALLYVFFCFEIGVFLLVFPWMDVWPHNWFSGLGPGWYALWSSPYFRGAVSGLGLVNIAIAFAELFRLRRFSKSL